jgi:phytoene dehydrogenase-like protein
VKTSDGITHDADIVAVNVSPNILFQKLLAPEHVPETVLAHFDQYKCGSGAFRMNVALSGMPNYPGRQVPHCLEAGIIMAPTLDYMDRAWLSARQQGWSEKPVVEMLIPSLVDDSLAPAGCHVASLFCQHFDPALGLAWEANRDVAAGAILDVVDGIFPGFRGLIEGMQVLSPWDLEREFSLPNGDIFHGKLTLEQLFSARPGFGLAQYRMPCKGLYLCGSGAHPGGGVSGIPGRNAARRILGK